MGRGSGSLCGWPSATKRTLLGGWLPRRKRRNRGGSRVAKLDEKQKEQLRTLTVEMLLELRRAYLATPGCNPLKHWDQLQNRMLSAARRSASPDEWATLMQRGLQLPALSKSGCRALIDLGGTVRELGAAADWLALIERELGLVMAMTRLAAEKRREQYDTETGEVTT